MRKHFLLLLWLTLLPLAGWAHTAVWTSGNEVEEFSYTGSQPTFNLTVQNGYQGYPCEFVGVGTTAPTGYNNQYRYSIHPTMADAQSGTNQITTPVTDAGTYWLRVSVRGRNPGTGYNFENEYFTLSFKINKIDNSITGFAMNDWTEGETPVVPSYTSATFGTPTWQYSIDGGNSWSTTAPTTHGYYKVRAFIDESTNYNAFTSEVKDYKIFKVAELTTVPSLAPGLVYNDGDLSLISGTPAYPVDYSTTTGGVIYKVTDVLLAPTDDTDAVNEPTKKDAGTYYVWYKVKGDGDLYLDGAWKQVGTTAVKIAKRDITATDFAIVGLENIYTDADQKLVQSFTMDPDRGTVQVSIDQTTWVDVDALEAKDVADYPLYVKITGDANHNNYESTDAEAIAKITKADNSFTVEPTIATGLIYDGSALDLITNVAAVDAHGAEVQYKVDYEPFDGTPTTGTFTPMASIQGTEAGTYKIYYQAMGNSNWNAIDPITDPLVIVIAQADNAITNTPELYTGDALTYNGELQDLIKVAPTVTYGDITYYIDAEATAIAAVGDVEKKDAGEYLISYAVDGGNNYKSIEKTQLTTEKAKINKKGLTLTGASLGADYDPALKYDKAQLFMYSPGDFVAADASDAQAIASGLITVTLDNGDDYNKLVETETETGLNAGLYAIKLAVNTEATVQNYEIEKLDDGQLTINKIDPTAATVAPTFAELTYTGEDLPLATAGTSDPSEGKWMYRLEGAAAEAIPTGNEVGEYTVYYQFVGDRNHNDIAEASEVVKIVQAEPVVTVDIADWTYGGPAVDPTATADFKGEDEPTITYSVKGEDSWSAEVPTDQGEYTVKASVAEAKNWKAAEATKDFTIAKADLEIELDEQSKVYGEADPELTYSAVGFKYDDDATTIGLEATRDAGETVGTYTITAVYDSDKAKNYNITIVDNTLTITAAELTITVDNKEKTFEDADPEFTAVLTGLTNGDKAEDMGLTFSRESGEDVGEYAITAEATKASNYTVTVEDGVLTINQQPVTPTAPKALALTYNGLDQALVVAGEAKGSTVKYAITAIDGTPVDGALAENIPEAKNAATYTVSYEFTPGSNFSIADDLAEGTVDVKINKAHVSYRMGNQTETYTGEAFAPVEGQAYQLVDGDLMVGDEDAFTFDWVEGFDATTAAEEGRVFTDLVATFKDGIENYTIQCVQEGKLYIKKADLEEDVHYTAPVAIEGLVYDPTGKLNPQKLVTAGEVVKVDDKPLGTIMFSNDEKGTYSAEIPTGVAASSYTVWYYVAGDENHNDTEPAIIDGVEIAAYGLTDNMLPKEYQEGKVVEANYTAETQTFNIPLTGLTEVTKDNPDGDYTVALTYEGSYDYEGNNEELVIKHAGLYTFTFTGAGNYEGKLTAQVKINKLELIATAPNATKTYDATTKVEEEEFGAFEFNGLLKGDKIDLGTLKVADVISVPTDAINVGEYELAVDLDEFPEQIDYVVKAADILPGTLTIDPAEAVTIGFKEGVTYSKSYATEDNLAVIAGDLTAIDETVLFDAPADVAQLLTISREEGEVYKKDGYTVSLDFSTKESLLKAIAQFKANYKGVSFGTTKFFITPFAGNIKVSIASASSVYDGNVPTYGWDTEEDTYLSNMVVTGIDADKKAEIFSKLPTVTISGITADAGDYNIELAKDFESVNFDPEKITLVLGSYFTINPFDLSEAEITIPTQQAKVGDKADDVIDYTDFTITGIPDDAQTVFTLAVGKGFIDNGTGKIIEGKDFTKGLVLVANDEDPYDLALNYTGWENGEITGNLIVEGGKALVLDDSAPVSLDASAGTVTVSFSDRKINANSWNVLALPFDVTPAQLSDAFGYAAVDVLDQSNDIDGEVHFNLITTGTIEAGTPFVFKPGKPVEGDQVTNFTGVTFSGVQVKAEADYLAKATVTDAAENKFIGIFASKELSGAQYWYMSAGKWYDASARSVTLKPLRAYVEIANPSAGARFFFEEADGTVTAIDAISFNKADAEGMYNLNGVKVNNLNRKGVYIKNGVKVIK